MVVLAQRFRSMLARDFGVAVAIGLGCSVFWKMYQNSWDNKVATYYKAHPTKPIEKAISLDAAFTWRDVNELLKKKEAGEELSAEDFQKIVTGGVVADALKDADKWNAPPEDD